MMAVWTGIRQLLSPPVFEDEEQTRIAGLLNTILLIFLLAMATVPSILFAVDVLTG